MVQPGPSNTNNSIIIFVIKKKNHFILIIQFPKIILLLFQYGTLLCFFSLQEKTLSLDLKTKAMFGNNFYFLFSKTCFWEYEEKKNFLYFLNQKHVSLVEI